MATVAAVNQDALREFVRQPLPSPRGLRQAARASAAQISVGKSAFLLEQGASSELEYKQHAMREGRIMYHAHIGMNDVQTTARALRDIHRELATRGYRLDRAGFALDRRMGLPATHRERVAAETGPMLTADSDWDELAQAAPVQPHLGDFMIGQPASVANCAQALRIGCTTVGNLSQYFSFAAPGWSDQVATASASCEAMMLLAEFRRQGTLLHSYLEDGYGALFRHCASIAAWAMLERYIVEELIGARLSHCIGGLTTDPVRRAGWVFALQEIHQGRHIGSMIYGDTLSFGREFEHNRALTAEYLLWDMLAQLRSPSGHALLPLPVTEAIRIPSADEIIEAQLFGRRVEASARRLYPHVDFTAADAFAANLVRQGKTIYANALAGLADLGADLENPLQLLYLLKQMGAQNFEALYAAEFLDDIDGYSDMYRLTQNLVDEHRPLFVGGEMGARVAGRRFIVASADVHEHAAGALAQLLDEAGAEVVYLGAEQNPDDLVRSIREQGADALLLSTHNGMALEYATQLRDLLDRDDLSLPVIMGGVLNQKVEDQALPVPVAEQIRALGMQPALSLPSIAGLLSDSG